MLALYSSVICLSSIILMSIFIYYQNENLLERNKDTHINTVSQFKNYSDQYFLNRIYSLMTIELFKEYENFSNLFYDDSSYIYDRNNFERVLEIKKYLTNLHMNIDFIESISIYNKKHDIFISSTSGIFYQVYEQRAKYENLLPYNTLTYVLEQKNNQFWVPPSENNSFYKDRDILSFAQFMPIFSTPQDCDIIFLVNIDLNKIYGNFLSNINPAIETYTILDEQSNVLFDSRQEILRENYLDPQILNAVADTTEDYSEIKLEQAPYLLACTTSQVNNWKYIYMVANDEKTVISSLKWSLLCFTCIISLCFICVLAISKWLYSPLKKLIAISKKELDEEANENDIKTIDKAFHNMLTHVDQLELRIQNSNEIILNNIINDLINGRIKDLASLNYKLGLLKKKFIHPEFFLFITKIEENTFKDFNYELQELLHVGIIDLIENFYGQIYGQEFKIYTIFNYSGYFISVVNIDAKEYEQEVSILKELLNRLNHEYDSIFNLSVSEVINELGEFYKYYQETLDYFKYSFIYNNNNIFNKNSIKVYEESTEQINGKVMEHLQILLKTQKFEEFKNQIIWLYNQIKSQGFSFIYTYNLFIQIIHIISTEAANQNITMDKFSHQSLLEHFSKVNEANEYIAWISDVIDELSHELNERNSNMDSTIINDVITYMRNNIDSQMSLNSVAEYFGMSTGHLSRLFKTKAGINFSDFIINIKFETAAALLIEQPHLRIAELAEELGYSNIPYFTKLFKTKYGMTPTQYRKMHRKADDSAQEES